MTSPELAVIIPTRGRPQNVRKVIEAWDFTYAWGVADMVLVADSDDPEIQGYRELLAGRVSPEGGSAIKLIEIPSWGPMVHKLDATAVALAADGEHFAIGFAGDDHVPQTINWAQTYLAELHKLGTGMVYGDDGYQGRKLSTEWAVTADTVVALGRMIPAAVEHMYCDNSIMDLFSAARMLTYLPQVRIEHMHPVAGKASTDGQYDRVNSSAQFKKDHAAYQSWKSGRMSADLAKLKGVRPGRWRPGNTAVDLPKGTKRMGNRSPFPRHFKQVKGLTPEDVGITLADFALAVPRDQAIVELGVHHGKTALQMAWGAGQAHGVGNGAHVWAIDPWDLPGNVYAEGAWDDLASARAWARYHVQSLGYANAITIVHGFSHEVAGSWSGSQVGLLFIDGDHTEKGIRRDIEAWMPHLAPGAVIAIDDYVSPDFPAVHEVVDQLVANGVMEPVTIYHDRLAVTRIRVGKTPEQHGEEVAAVADRLSAITGEGVSPSPVPPTHALIDAELKRVGLDEESLLAEADDLFEPESETSAAPEVDAEVSTLSVEDRLITHEGEFQDIPAGVDIRHLTHAQAKHLARVRGIVLGVRKDKKTETLQAIVDGR